MYEGHERGLEEEEVGREETLVDYGLRDGKDRVWWGAVKKVTVD